MALLECFLSNCSLSGELIGYLTQTYIYKNNMKRKIQTNSRHSASTSLLQVHTHTYGYFRRDVVRRRRRRRGMHWPHTSAPIGAPYRLATVGGAVCVRSLFRVANKQHENKADDSFFYRDHDERFATTVLHWDTGRFGKSRAISKTQ